MRRRSVWTALLSLALIAGCRDDATQPRFGLRLEAPARLIADLIEEQGEHYYHCGVEATLTASGGGADAEALLVSMSTRFDLADGSSVAESLSDRIVDIWGSDVISTGETLSSSTLTAGPDSNPWVHVILLEWRQAGTEQVVRDSVKTRCE